MRSFVDPNDSYSYEDWMNDMATRDDDPCAQSEEDALEDVARGRLRIIGAQRKRKLRKRGESVWWHQALESYVWAPSNNQGNRSEPEG